MRMKIGIRYWYLGLLLICIVSGPLFAWNKATHMVTGAIAYRELEANSPETLAQLLSLLREHPHYQTRWLDKINRLALSEEEKDMYLFMLAARWPDDIRNGDKAYHHPGWHYINYPFSPFGWEPEGNSAREKNGNNIVYTYRKNLNILQSSAEAGKKAVALCWVLHLIGDVHQPLHTTALFSAQYPQGDKGGNLFYIKARPDAKTINLHAFWDGLLTGSDNFQSVANTATRLRHTFQRQSLPELTHSRFSDWTAESVSLAREKVYLNGTLRGSSDPDAGALLPSGYAFAARELAQRRVALAGYRIADALISVVS
jgi:hypothetical protein